MKNKNGFTLIELLAVVVIMGIIAIVAIPAVNNVITNNRVKVFYEIAESMCDAVKYTINSGEGLNLKEEGDTYRVLMSNLALQKEAVRSPFDVDWVANKCYVVATRVGDNIEYQVFLEDTKGNCIASKYQNIRDQVVINGNCNIANF